MPFAERLSARGKGSGERVMPVPGRIAVEEAIRMHACERRAEHDRTLGRAAQTAQPGKQLAVASTTHW